MRVFLSFLGLGPYNKTTKTNDYEEAVYEYNRIKSKQVKFVQVAELEILSKKNRNYFEKIIIVGTKKSLELHFNVLSSAIRELLNTNIVKIEISEDMSSKGQWEWFEKILAKIDQKDRLTIDLTHGYRSIPIIFSTAINFLQRSKNVHIEHVFYGAYEKNRDISPIIDMKEFYVINELADGVSRLIENADVKKLANVISDLDEKILPELSDEKIIKSFEELTDLLRNINVNNISKKTEKVLILIKSKVEKATDTGRLLLQLVMDKFISLTTDHDLKGMYNANYFKIQIEIIKILIDHKLFMQVFTVMREFIGSIGMLSINNLLNLSNKKLKKKRFQYAEIFINMVQYNEKEWTFSKESINNNKSEYDRKNDILPFYRKLEKINIIDKLSSFIKEMTNIRNGFDHAWMTKKIPDDIETKSKEYLESLKEITEELIIEKIIKSKG